ncbi:MAG: hypothetical protein LBP40_01705 [Campylobacteraceae bacterium]|jgi:hypothetical protein|nr:hypothetical protein [Campylobacteraceae bacterium]
MADKQIQKAGNNAQQLQANNIVINNIGIDEKRAREICQETSVSAVKTYTEEALNTANARIIEFENKLLPKIEAVEGALQSFADPSFQLLLIEAQKTAAATEREEDYDLLSELLIHRFQKGENRKIRAGISHAVKIIDEISDDALLGLTALHSVSCFFPVTGDINQGLTDLNALFEKVIYNQLPKDNDWLDHLDILDTIRINSFRKLKKIKQYYPEQLDGYIAAGIKKTSENYQKAIEILNKVKLPNNILVEHVLNQNYVRINVANKNEINTFSLIQPIISYEERKIYRISFSDEQKNALKSIYELYIQDDNIKNKNIEQFMIKWNKFPKLKELQEWWDSIPQSFNITMVGRVLAHANAQRCDKTLPSLN